MKKIVASVGLVALGASAVQTASAQTLATPDASKPWSVSATVRGFYDDNVSTLRDNAQPTPGATRGTFGWEISPTAALAWSFERTTVSLGYLYSLKYYQNKPSGATSHDDSSHTFNVSLNHSFSESVQARVSDSFVVGQEPDLLRAGNAYATYQRIKGDNIRNFGSLGLDAQFTPVFGLGVGYDNAYYDYADAGTTNSLAGVLNRIEHGAHVEALYSLAPQTKGLFGYRYRETDYTADEAIGTYNGIPYKSDARDSRQHTLYVGVEHKFSPDLSGNVRVGASYSDYMNASDVSGSCSPYAQASLRYVYLPESFIEGGITYDRSATDVLGSQNASYAVDTEAASLYATINHRFTPKIFGSVMGQFQNSTINHGTFDGKTEQFYLLGLNLEYRFSSHLSANVGYNYDKLDSGLPGASNRSFDRNRVYAGITASY